MSRLLREHRAGWVVPPGDAAALAGALAEALEDPAQADLRRQGARDLLAAFRWEKALAPLLRFCREPLADLAKERFAHRPTASSPRDELRFRILRRVRRLGL